MAGEDVDELLEQYLEGDVLVDAVTHVECKERHTELHREVETAIKEAVAKSTTNFKLWLVGSLLGVIISVLGGYTCAMTEVGAYREKIDNATKQLEKLERGQDYLIRMHMQNQDGRAEP